MLQSITSSKYKIKNPDIIFSLQKKNLEEKKKKLRNLVNEINSDLSNYLENILQKNFRDPQLQLYHNKFIAALIVLLTGPYHAPCYNWEEDIAIACKKLKSASTEAQDGMYELANNNAMSAAANIKKITFQRSEHKSPSLFIIISEIIKKGPKNYQMMIYYMQLVSISERLIINAVEKTPQKNNKKLKEQPSTQKGCVIN